MLEGARQAANNFKTEIGPEFHSTFVCADDKIELHGAEAAPPRVFERMKAHSACNATALRGGRSDIAAVCNVRASSLLVCLQEICTQHGAVLFPYERFFSRGEPVFERLLSAHIARKCVRIAAPDHWLEDFPDCVAIAALGGTNRHALTSTQQVFQSQLRPKSERRAPLPCRTSNPDLYRRRHNPFSC